MSKDYQQIKDIDLAIIGGGPAGLSAAISASLKSRINKENKKIAIFETENKIGKSILKTGNGRCNLSNYFIEENKGEQYNHSKFCNDIYDFCKNNVNKLNLFNCSKENFDINPAMQMFDNLGLACYCDDEGRMYPYTNKATSVVDVLRYKIEDLNIDIYCNHKFESFEKDSKSNNYLIKFANGQTITAEKIIFSIGSAIFDNKILKNNLIKLKKVLGPIKTDNKLLKGLDGVKAHVSCSIIDSKNQVLYSEIGEILFRPYGVSGICVFNTSRFVNEKEKQTLSIDFAPEDSVEDLTNIVRKRFNKISELRNKSISAERLFAGMILPNIINNICAYSYVDYKRINKNDILKICKSLKSFQLKIIGIGDAKQCQISRGGISVDSINRNTLEYKPLKGIYFAGECVDIDGPCGGYNLHWAWTSGILAGLTL